MFEVDFLLIDSQNKIKFDSKKKGYFKLVKFVIVAHQKVAFEHARLN